ncbi:MAG: hypothetical protein [Microviridae sp.]|nr:MAG: hypothetical protein [Microviridae sp.]
MTTKVKKEKVRPLRRTRRELMYERPVYRQTSLSMNQSVQGETIEQKIERIVNNKEPIKDGAPIIYTERKEGIRPSTNIRTDRFEIAVEAATKIEKSYKARREERAKTAEADGGAKPIQGESKDGTKAS